MRCMGFAGGFRLWQRESNPGMAVFGDGGWPPNGSGLLRRLLGGVKAVGYPFGG